MSALSSNSTRVRVSIDIDDDAAGTGSTDMYGESPFAASPPSAPAAPAESFSFADPNFSPGGARVSDSAAAIAAAAAASARAECACLSLCSANTAVSRTTWHSSSLAVLSASAHSSDAIAPSASAASCLTMLWSLASSRTSFSFGTARVACI